MAHCCMCWASNTFDDFSGFKTKCNYLSINHDGWTISKHQKHWSGLTLFASGDPASGWARSDKLVAAQTENIELALHGLKPSTGLSTVITSHYCRHRIGGKRSSCCRKHPRLLQNLTLNGLLSICLAHQFRFVFPGWESTVTKCDQSALLAAHQVLMSLPGGGVSVLLMWATVPAQCSQPWTILH